MEQDPVAQIIRGVAVFKVAYRVVAPVPSSARYPGESVSIAIPVPCSISWPIGRTNP